MEHFVTLFDSGFLLQGLALHRSLEEQAGAFTLWVICMDEGVERVIKELNLASLEAIPLREVEAADPRLLEVKPTRSRGEYCWTLTSFSYQAVFAKVPDAQRVTYVDADVCVFGLPSQIFKEMEDAGADVLLTEHAYADEYQQESTAGRYCVQFLPFRKTAIGLEIMSWWQDRCIEWCFNRHEDGKFGDQKYLDDWLERWPGHVHSLRDHSLTLAPWNASYFSKKQVNDGIYHFHGLRIYGRLVCLWESYRIPWSIRKKYYRSYILKLNHSAKLLDSVGFTLEVRSFPIKKGGLAKLLGRVLIKRNESWAMMRRISRN